MTPTKFYAYTQSAQNVGHINSNSTRQHLSFTKFLIQNSGATAWRNTNIIYCSLKCTPGSGSVLRPTQKLRTSHSSNTLSIKGNLLPSPTSPFQRSAKNCTYRARGPHNSSTIHRNKTLFTVPISLLFTNFSYISTKSHKMTSSSVLLWQDLRDYNVYIVGLNLIEEQSKLEVEFRKMLASLYTNLRFYEYFRFQQT